MQSFPRLLVLAGLLWVVAVGAGLKTLLVYQTTPGENGSGSTRWPSETALKAAPGKMTLVMILHPRCPCSRAGVAELARALAKAVKRPTTYAVFVRPKGVPGEWEKTDLWMTVSGIPDVQVYADEAGAEARRFGASTSGQTLLFDEHGRLVFRGGITGSRGHEGANAGRDSVIAFLNGSQPNRTDSFVFGCSLLGPAREN